MQNLQSEISQMPYNEKFIMMEQLWSELTLEADNKRFTPKWHIDELNKREKKVKNNEAIFYDISEVKNRLGRN